MENMMFDVTLSLGSIDKDANKVANIISEILNYCFQLLRERF
ncbi:hypothetical protein IC006_0682 [Sulfuracidifex tepidarius]|nr:hypothetical protein IC006_0682 [Sulfuracidifex tepidarius]